MCSEIDCIYIIGHPEYEKERIKYVSESLMKHGFSSNKLRICCPTWGNTLSSDTCLQTYDPYIQRGYGCYNFKCRWLLKGEISLVLNFYSAIRDAAEKGYDKIIVLESDVRLRHDFRERFEVLMKKAQEVNWSYISLSDGVGTHSEGYENFQWYRDQDLKKPNEKQKYCPFRCTDSMIFRKPFIQYLAQRLLPFRDCLDWELNYRILEFGGEAYWAEPHLIEQATQKRMSASSLKA